MLQDITKFSPPPPHWRFPNHAQEEMSHWPISLATFIKNVRIDWSTERVLFTCMMIEELKV